MAVASDSTPMPWAGLPAVLTVTGELRALCVHDRAPPDCGNATVPDNAFAPHLKAGETAVIDPEDREPLAGEIYLVKISDPREPDGVKLELVQLRPRPCNFVTDRELLRTASANGWMMHFTLIRHYGRRLSVDEVLGKLGTGEMSVCDGPLDEAGMRDKIVGRVVGVILAGAA